MNKLLKTTTVIFLTGFLLHFFWEYSQMIFYACFTCPIDSFQWVIFRATIADAFYMVFFYIVGISLHKKKDWLSHLAWSDLKWLSPAGITTGVIIEYHAIFVAFKWSYSELMPSIGGIGLIPILQMIILPPLTFWVSKKFLT
jgi:hypothetical protein